MATRFEPPNIPADTVLWISATVTMQCPASHAFDTQLDTANWPKWNSFCPKVDVTPAAKSSTATSGAKTLKQGDHMNLHVRMTPTSAIREQKVVVSEFEDPRSGSGEVSNSGALYRVCWVVEGMPRFMLRGNRVNEFRETASSTGEPQCEYKTWEAMAGPVANIVKRMYSETLQSRFEDWANDLKEHAESTWMEKNAGATA